MDLNYLYYRQQVERMRAAVAVGDESRCAHLDLADRYDLLIESRKRDRMCARPTAKD